MLDTGAAAARVHDQLRAQTLLGPVPASVTGDPDAGDPLGGAQEAGGRGPPDPDAGGALEDGVADGPVQQVAAADEQGWVSWWRERRYQPCGPSVTRPEVRPRSRAPAASSRLRTPPPGTSSSMASRPLGRRTWAWRPCGRPLRGRGASGSSSRSSTITSSTDRARAAAASMPAILAPMTTAVRGMDPPALGGSPHRTLACLIALEDQSNSAQTRPPGPPRLPRRPHPGWRPAARPAAAQRAW